MKSLACPEMLQSQQPNIEKEMEALGENATSRVEAVNAWAGKNFPPEEFEAIQNANHFFSNNNLDLIKSLNKYIKRETALY